MAGDTSGDTTTQETVAVTQAVTATIDADVLKQYLDYIHAVVEEAVLEFQPDGVHCDATDAPNVIMVSCHLSDGRFDEYDAVDINTGVPLRKLKAVLETFEGAVAMTVNAAENTITLSDEDAHKPPSDVAGNEVSV